MDYLDVTLNLSDGSYKPFYKPNSEINCIDKESNHPPSIITSLHLSVESPLLKLSFAEDVFTEEASLYQEALKRVRRNHKLSYNNYFILTTIILLYIYIIALTIVTRSIVIVMVLIMIMITIIASLNLILTIIGIIMTAMIFRIILIVIKIRIAMIAIITVRLKLIVMIMEITITIIIRMILWVGIKNRDNTTTDTNNNDNNDNTNPRTNKQRKTNIIWFNPLSKNVATKVDRYPFNLIDKHFPQHRKFYKSFNSTLSLLK